MPEVVLEADALKALVAFRRSLRRAAPELRRDLPWIAHDDPWAVFVAEIMLQQTSTGRVVEPWRRFLDTFASPSSCAQAPLAEVLRLWSGLGYPRRAKSLHDAAREMCERFDSAVPASVDDLLSLPGVGPYTAHAVASFAFGAPVAVLDTNVGRVLARALANRPLRPREAQSLASKLLPREGAAAFNQAMIDLGAQFCTRDPRCMSCPLRRACRFQREGGTDPAPRSAAVSRPQASFANSDRQVRGRILKLLHETALTRRNVIVGLADVDVERIEVLLAQLEREGLIGRVAGRFVLGGHAEVAR
ncbi:MAG: A/G-specific adenine glycosylase [Actinomycetota bacterium]|nr:A/G-specific adenine glycosylase [Actinomycetota bacterium]